VSDEGDKEVDIAQARGRLMVLQVDTRSTGHFGVYTLSQPDQGVCPGIEIKSVVLYPESSPAERWMLADPCDARTAEALLPQVAGLLKQARVTSKDILALQGLA
jgi:hypothetical protein